MRILVVDDDPAIRLLASTALEQLEDCDVASSANGIDGLNRARERCPDLILLDQLMPDMPGSEVLKKLREDPATRACPVAFFTAKSNKDDIEAMQRMGVAGIITKPFDPSQLGHRVVEILEDHGRRQAAANLDRQSTQPTIEGLAREFLTSGVQESDEVLAMLDSAAGLDRDRVSHIVHRWVGRGGTFGHPDISQIAQRIEVLLDTAPEDTDRLRTELQVVRQTFRDRPAAREHGSSTAPAIDVDLALDGAVGAAARDVLDGKRIALVGFDHGEAERVAATVESTGAFSRSLDGNAFRSASDQCRHFDLVVIRLESELDTETTHAIQNQPKPVLLIGSAGSIGVDSGLGNHVDFALWPVRAEELLMRAHRLLSAPRTETPLGSGDNRSIVVADDDPTVNALIEHTLTSYEFDCHTAESGTEALELVQKTQPAAAILDVNMPGMSGFEVLSRLKSAKQTRSVPVFLVTARRREVDVLRGFSLGAEDYVTKPFNPIELVARLKRILNGSRSSSAGS